MAAAVSAMLALLACGGQGSAPPAPATDTRAADLRAQLDWLLAERLLLTAKTTSATLAGRTDDATAYGGLLARNGGDLGDLVGGALGPGAGSRLDQLWVAQDGATVRYAAAAARQDRAARDQAIGQLTSGFVPGFADFASEAAGLSRDRATGLANAFVGDVQRIVDDQASRSWPVAYADLRAADGRMRVLGDALAPAIASREKLMGSVSTRAIDLRVTLDLLLQEHEYLATDVSRAALAGSPQEYQAAGHALGDNGADLGQAIGGLYGPDVQRQFDQLWSRHDDQFVAYVVAVARKDAAGQQRAATALTTGSAPELADFLAGTTGLPRDGLSTLAQEHVLTAREVVDAQAAHRPADAAQCDRVAAEHMAMIGDPVAAAIVRKLPRKFS